MDSSEITGLLIKWNNGDQSALEALMPLVENELHRMAHNYMRQERPGHLLQTTALINEAFIRLVDQRNVQWQNRAHFYGIAAIIMRRVLIKYAKDQKRFKRGGNLIQISLDEATDQPWEISVDLVELDAALTKLEAINSRQCLIVELRFFGGLSNEEVAEVLKVAEITVIRDWKLAKARLAREMRDGS
jgi:RNA polymerase sigma factor (TIGR02999 family)